VGEAGDGVQPRDRWYCGPPGDRRAYVVDDIRAMRGGQGHVLRAERRTFAGDPAGYEGPVSLKVSSEVLEPGQVGRMRERWEALAGLDHPNLARPVELFLGPGLFRTDPPPGGDEDVLYISAAWVDGRGLRGAAPLPPGDAIALAGDLAAGVAELHAQGILHRDIHPGNVILGADGRAVLIDFGSSRPDDGTATATVAGALGFIAPEMLNGAGSTAADRWGLGMVTIFALLGHPRGTTTRPALEAELAGALGGMADRRGAVRLLMAMIDDDPDARPRDARRWARDLEACLTHRTGRPLVLGAAVGAAVVLAACTAGAVVLTDDDVGGGAPREQVVPPASEPLPCTPGTAAPPGSGASPALAEAVARLAPDAWAQRRPRLPTTNPHFLGGRLHLDFGGGYMEADAADLAALLVGATTVEDAVVVDDRDDQLEGVDVTGHIVRQDTGTAWWVDDEGARHWIATGDDWSCLGGDDAVAANDVHGWAVATLPLGEAATCE
jgi:Protein kinase domain